MKRDRLAQALNDVDDALLEKADPEKPRAGKRKSAALRIALVATLSVLMVAGCLWLFIPFKATPPDVSQYADSPYFDIIEKLNAATFVKPAFKNNFDKYVLNIFRGAMADDAEGSADRDGAGGEYAEVTDNQVAGVIEADRIKRSSTHIYYLNDDALEVYSIAGTSSMRVGRFSLTEAVNAEQREILFENFELYLSSDCESVTVIAPYYDVQFKRNCICVLSVDVRDPAAMQVTRTVRMSGNYLSSRMVDGELLLLGNFRVKSNADFGDERQFLPQIDAGEGFVSILPEKITYPETLSSASYTVVCKLKESGLSLVDCAAFLSYSTEVYASAEDLFVTRSYGENVEIDGTVYERTMTEIRRIGYTGEALAQRGVFTVEGSVKNQYSMDVYNGIFRVVTTTRELPQSTVTKDVMLDVDTSDATNAALYCFDLATGELRASVMKFAPAGETVESVRFDGDVAYVCTAVVIAASDPVFFFDLSDMDNITYKDTGEIDGYSTSLINFGEGYLLGVGVGEEWDTVKIEVFEESEHGVVSVCAYELKNASYSTEYKSYFIDRERGLFGLGVGVREGGNGDAESRYILLAFDGSTLREVLHMPHGGISKTKRAVLIDGYFYIFGDVLTVKKLW